MFTYVIWYNNYSGGMPASSADSVRLNLNTKQEVGLYEKKDTGIKRGEIRKQAKSLKSSRLWTAGKQVTTE